MPVAQAMTWEADLGCRITVRRVTGIDRRGRLMSGGNYVGQLPAVIPPLKSRLIAVSVVPWARQLARPAATGGLCLIATSCLDTVEHQACSAIWRSASWESEASDTAGRGQPGEEDQRQGARRLRAARRASLMAPTPAIGSENRYPRWHAIRCIRFGMPSPEALAAADQQVG